MLGYIFGLLKSFVHEFYLLQISGSPTPAPELPEGPYNTDCCAPALQLQVTGQGSAGHTSHISSKLAGGGDADAAGMENHYCR